MQNGMQYPCVVVGGETKTKTPNETKSTTTGANNVDSTKPVGANLAEVETKIKTTDDASKSESKVTNTTKKSTDSNPLFKKQSSAADAKTVKTFGQLKLEKNKDDSKNVVPAKTSETYDVYILKNAKWVKIATSKWNDAGPTIKLNERGLPQMRTVRDLSLIMVKTLPEYARGTKMSTKMKHSVSVSNWNSDMGCEDRLECVILKSEKSGSFEYFYALQYSHMTGKMRCFIFAVSSPIKTVGVEQSCIKKKLPPMVRDGVFEQNAMAEIETCLKAISKPALTQNDAYKMSQEMRNGLKTQTDHIIFTF
jgi:hypothetical protein